MSVARYIVLGAGAIGCGLGGSLLRVGCRVGFVARGQQLAALAEHGLELSTPTQSERLDVEVFEDVRELSVTDGDVVLLCTKSQHVEAALCSLAKSAQETLPVVCAQNGVGSERLAAARFRHVYGTLVFVPATFLTPGRVALHSSPLRGALDVGRYPSGSDELAAELAADFERAGFRANATPAVMRLKYGKLLGNLESAAQALAGRDALGSDLVVALRAEATNAFLRAGIEYAPLEEMAERYGFVSDLPVAGVSRQGGSSWQSLARRTGSIESDHLNGEIVRIAERHDLRAPLNRALRDLALRAAEERWLPEALTLAEVVSLLSAQED